MIMVPNNLWDWYESALTPDLKFVNRYLSDSGFQNLRVIPTDFDIEKDSGKIKNYPVIIREEL